MSKSVGNFFTLRDVLELAPGEAVRFALLSGHYRSPLDWSPENLKQAKSAMDGFYSALRRVAEVEAKADAAVSEKLLTALEDDLNTPIAIAELHAISRALNKTEDPAEQAELKGRLLNSASLMGLLAQDPEDWFRWQPAASQQGGLSDDDIDALIVERKEVRAAKNWARADEIRDILNEEGIVLEDGPQGTTWKRG